MRVRGREGGESTPPMEPADTSMPDADLAEILALLRYLGPDDAVRHALLPFLRVYTEHKEAAAAPFVARPRKRQRRVADLCAGIAALVSLMLPALAPLLTL